MPARATITRSLEILIGSVVCLRFYVECAAQQRISFELKEGSKLTHEWGIDDTFCRGGGQKIVEVAGSFELVINQSSQSTGGLIENLELVSTDGEYLITGQGSYVESRDGESHVAEPPNPFVMTLRLVVNTDIANIRLGVEPIGITELTFPSIDAALFQQSSMARRDCFILGIKANPIKSEWIQFFRRGDVNGDGTRNITDPINILSILFSDGHAAACADAADGNDDGVIDISDAAFVLNYLFRGETLPPLPSTFCGVDATEDELGCAAQTACADPQE